MRKFYLLCQLMLISFAVFAEEMELDREYELKAAYLYNIFKFVNWPALNPAESPELIFCILEKDPSAGLFFNLEGKSVENFTLRVRENITFEKMGRCNIVYVKRNIPVQKFSMKSLKKGLLLIGENENFALQGGILNFYIDKNKLRFEINLEAAKKADIKFSSKLLKLARIVGQPQSGNGEGSR